MIPDEFSEMLFPLHLVTENIREKILRVNQLYQGLETPDAMIKYVAFAYDRKSPFLKLDSIIDRKVQSALKAGYEANSDGSFPDEVNELFKCRNKTCNEMIIRYCKLMKSRTYSMIVVGNQTMDEIIKELLDMKLDSNQIIEGSQRKIKLLGEAQSMADELDKMSADFLSDENKNLNEYLYLVTNNLQDYLTCEDWSKQEWNPPAIKSSLE